ncbi:hypothetical protein [Actinacidiphila glaucinigra]|uniref:phage terminase small subunit n=1 Tax=Actinacidiphila glaucinigra TaxID=235986 RepID=UPI00371EC124
MPGPRANPAKPYSRHRQAKGRAALVVLPPTCDLPVPPLPAFRTWSPEEEEAWDELWSGPQANQWDDSFIPVVAMFVVHASSILAGRASAWMAQEARHLSDRLGLTPQGMLQLGWVFGEDVPAPPLAPVKPLRGA